MAGTNPPSDTLDVVDDPTRLAAILSPLRRKLLGRLHESSDSAAGLARKLGLPRQQLNYHLRELERAGFVELESEQQRRGCVERRLRPTARAYVLGPSVLAELGADPTEVEDRFSSGYLIAAASRVAREVADLRSKAARAGKRLATFTLETEVSFATPEARAAFTDALADAIAKLATEHHVDGPSSRPFRFVVAGHAVSRRRRSS